MRVTTVTASRGLVAAMCAIAGFAVLGPSQARADEMDKRTVLTVNQPMQVTDRLLQPGTYVLVLVGGHSDRYTDLNTVEIFNGDQSRVIDTVVAVPSYRVAPTSKSQFTFWETPPGTARALRDWYYPGDNFGREFAYPKHPAVLTASAEVHTWAPQPTPAEAAVTPAPPTEVPTQTAEAAPAPAPEPAPAAPEPAPAAQAPEPAPAAAELPHTASAYPLIGLGGLLMVGLYSLLRLRQTM